MTITVRPAETEDAPYLKSWLMDPEILRGFPMANENEVDDSVRIWVSYAKQKAGVTVLVDGKQVGMANLYIQPFKKFAHQCLFSIIVESKERSKGIGTILLTELMRVAKEQFQIEILHLEVYDGNPAIRLYQRMGFKEYGRHAKFIKIDDIYIDKILMQRAL